MKLGDTNFRNYAWGSYVFVVFCVGVGSDSKEREVLREGIIIFWDSLRGGKGH
jgi:hypothetical protein